MPVTCRNDFQCQQTARPPNWPREHATVQSGNYACVFPSSGSSTGTCQFVVTAGEQCNVKADCAAFVFYTRFNLTTPTDLCAPRHCTLESTCGSPWQNSNAPTNHSYSKTNDGQISCCGGLPERSICSLMGANVDSCEYHNVCKFDLDTNIPSDPKDTNGFTPEEMAQLGLGFCQKIDQRNHVWIGVIITLISSTVLNLGLNGQKYALRKHDEKRVLKELEMEEEHERWRQELGWTEEQVQAEVDRLYEEKENRRGKLYRRLKPYMFWRAIFVSKLWAAGLLVFIVGNLGGFIALRFAPQSLTAPLGSISLISNVIIAPLINKEVLGRWDIAGIFFIVAGSVIVVVFSGIVAQDYKLCVLINLFQKPATIVYLSLIGFFIVFTFFFIKFVEKNVENEADMAIGVSAEKALQEEGRLYRMNSNMSNLSLAQRNRLGSSMPGALSSTSLASSAAANSGSKAKEQQQQSPKDLVSEKNNATSSSGTPLQAPKRLFLQEPGIALNSNISHHTMTSDASDTAVGTVSAIGTEPPHDHRRQSFGSSNSSGSRRMSVSSLDVGVSPKKAVPAGSEAAKQGPHLTFDEPRSPGDSPAPFRTGPTAVEGSEAASGQEGGMNSEGGPRSMMSRSQSMTPSVASNNRSIRRRRHNRSKDQQEGGMPLTMWQRFKRIELVPSLPEDKLIRRNSPLLRFCLPLSYAALGGMMASYTVLFAKSLINLLVTTIFDGQNQFTSFLAWVILIVTVVTAVSQVYWINMGLKKYDALLQVPVFFTIWVLLDIIGGGVYYMEFSQFTAKKYALFCFGVLTVFFGVALLAKRLALLAKEDVGESQPGSVSASRRESLLKEGLASRRASMVKDDSGVARTRRLSNASGEGGTGEDAGGVGAK
ncbi:NIPA-like protein 3 [Mortierella alpina]|nr:NIPA-like protein 3 [Mortierella alpina]